MDAEFQQKLIREALLCLDKRERYIAEARLLGGAGFCGSRRTPAVSLAVSLADGVNGGLKVTSGPPE